MHGQLALEGALTVGVVGGRHVGGGAAVDNGVACQVGELGDGSQ